MASTSPPLSLQGVTRCFNDNVEIFGLWYGNVFVWPDPWTDIWDDGSYAHWTDAWHDLWSNTSSDYIEPEPLEGAAHGNQ